MNADALVIGEFIKAAEFGEGLPKMPTWRIKGVQIERMPSMKKQGKEIDKGTVYFHDIDRGWVMNRTNVECLKALFGPETDGWVGKRVTLSTEPTKVGIGIRVHGSPDIDRPVTARWRVPRQAEQTREMVPTGAQTAARQPARHTAKSGADLVADVAAKLGVSAEDVGAFFAAQGIVPAKCNAHDYAAIMRDLEPGGPLRMAYDDGAAEPAGGAS